MDPVSTPDEDWEEPVVRTPSSRPTRPPLTTEGGVEGTALTSEVAPEPAPDSPLTRAARATLDVRESFLLLHADGSSSLYAISEMTGIPLDDVKRVFLRLDALGLVRTIWAPESEENDRPTVTPPPIER